MNTISEKLRKKMEKLLAMSKDSCNENESAIATRRLHALLSEYNLSKANIEQGEIDIGTDLFEYRNNPWMRTIAQSIAELNFCNMYYNKYKGKRSSWNAVIYVTGSSVNRMYAVSMIENVLRNIDRESRVQAIKTYGYKNGSYVTSFRNGAAYKISQRCDDLMEQAKNGELKSDDGETLPSLLSVYEREEFKIDEWFKSLGKTFKDASSRMSLTNSQGYSDGDAAGNKVQLSRGIINNAPKQLKG